LEDWGELPTLPNWPLWLKIQFGGVGELKKPLGGGERGKPFPPLALKYPKFAPRNLPKPFRAPKNLGPNWEKTLTPLKKEVWGKGAKSPLLGGTYKRGVLTTNLGEKYSGWRGGPH